MNKPLLIIAWLAAVGCGSDDVAPPNVVRIGVLTQLNIEDSWPKVVELARLNANEGLAGAAYKNMAFEVILGDTADKVDISTAAAQTMVRTDGVRAIVTDKTSIVRGMNVTNYDTDTTNDLGVPLICNNCTDPNLNNPDSQTGAVDSVNRAADLNAQKWVFKGVNNHLPVVALLADIIVAAANARSDADLKVEVMNQNDSSGVSQVASLDAALDARHPGTYVEGIFHPRDSFDPAAYDWTQIVEQTTDDTTTTFVPNLGDSDNNNDYQVIDTETQDFFPDAIVSGTIIPSMTAYIKALRTAGSTIPVMGLHSTRTTQVIAQLADLADGFECVSQVVTDGISGDHFAAQLVERTSFPPTFRDAHLYDGVTAFMLAAVIASRDLGNPAEVTAAQIRDALPQTSDPAGEVIYSGSASEFQRAVEIIAAGGSINYEGASGNFDFDENQNVAGRFGHYRVVDGAWAEVGSYDCVTVWTTPFVAPSPGDCQ